MQVSTLSNAYADQMLQRLLGLGQASGASSAGQNVPDPGDPAASAGQPPGASPSPAPMSASVVASQRFASDTLSALLGLQQQPQSGAAGAASQLINAVDTNGDGQLSASEITAALNQGGVNVSQDSVQAAISKLDTNGDGQLSASELASGMQAEGMQTQPHHHHHHGGHGAAGLAANMIGAADSNGDGVLSADEVASALGQGGSGSNSTTSAALQSAFAKLDTNGDGKLSVEELTSALQSAFGSGAPA